METIATLRALFEATHGFLEGTVADVSPEHACWQPPGAPAPIAAQYAHVVCAEDMGFQLLLGGGKPLFEGVWHGRTGLQTIPPLYPGADVKGWSRSTAMDLIGLRTYAAAVYEATDAYLAGIHAGYLTERTVDLSAMGFGLQPAFFVITAMLSNIGMHSGEISCIKGMLGAKGYPV